MDNSAIKNNVTKEYLMTWEDLFGIFSNIKLKYYVHCDRNLIIHTEKYITLHTHTHTKGKEKSITNENVHNKNVNSDFLWDVSLLLVSFS